MRPYYGLISLYRPIRYAILWHAYLCRRGIVKPFMDLQVAWMSVALLRLTINILLEICSRIWYRIVSNYVHSFLVNFSFPTEEKTWFQDIKYKSKKIVDTTPIRYLYAKYILSFFFLIKSGQRTLDVAKAFSHTGDSIHRKKDVS